MRRVLIGLLLLAAAGCSEPPQKEIDQAQFAIDNARTAGADTYAADEYSAASAALQKARTSVDERDYRQALSYAIAARQRAVEAAGLVPEAKARQKAAAEAAMKTAGDRMMHLETVLREAEQARAPVQQVRAARAALDAARASLQEPRRLLDEGNVAQATASLAGVRATLDAAALAVEALPQRPRGAKARRH